MKVIDLHCDTVSEIYEKRKAGQKIDILDNKLMLSLTKMKKADYLLQNFACFINLEREKSPFIYANKLIDIFDEEMAKNTGLIKQIKSYEDIENNIKNSYMSACLTIEEGEACEGEISKLEHFYNRGVRMMTLTWNYENSLAFPNKKIFDKDGKYAACTFDMENGLKAKGKEFVEAMEELGIIVDVSHLNDAGIFDVLEISKKPFVASHSNSRGVCPHPRNLSDEMIKKMADKGCIAGINFYSAFLNEKENVSKISDIILHIKYMLNKGGEDFVALGSDYDGFDNKLEWDDMCNTEFLFEEIKKAGISERVIDKIKFENVLRVYKELL